MALRVGNESILTRPLTDDEARSMEQEVSRARADNELHEWVSTAGLLQYVLVPGTVIAALVLLRRKPAPAFRAAAGVTLAVAAVCGFFMVWRGYFTSLGW